MLSLLSFLTTAPVPSDGGRAGFLQSGRLPAHPKLLIFKGQIKTVDSECSVRKKGITDK